MLFDQISELREKGLQFLCRRSREKEEGLL